MLESLKQLPHAILLVGQYDLKPLVQKWVDSKKKQHPDVHQYYPEGKSGMHPMESLKELQKQAALVPLESTLKFFIIHDAERMLLTSANALLKTLEEPPAKTILILLTNHEQALLPTVRSRCQTFRFPLPEKREDPLADKLHAAVLGDSLAIKEIDVTLEKERKAWEKELLAELPKDMTMAQKEGMIKEIEGTLSTRYQTRVFALFEELLIWHRDEFAKRCGSPHLLSQREVPFRPLSELSERLSKARVAIQRGMKLTSAFDYILQTKQ